MSDWRKRSRAAMDAAIAALPADATAEQLLAAADAAYPFGPRSHHPYKMWLKERAVTMRRLGLRPPLPKPEHLSPLERMMRASGNPPA